MLEMLEGVAAAEGPEKADAKLLGLEGGVSGASLGPAGGASGTDSRGTALGPSGGGGGQGLPAVEGFLAPKSCEKMPFLPACVGCLLAATWAGCERWGLESGDTTTVEAADPAVRASCCCESAALLCC